MREFYFTDLMCRNEINLEDYKSTIQLAVQTVLEDLEDADIIVEEKRFVILDQNILNEDARAIGRLLARSPLGDYCIDRPVLFVGRNRGNGEREYLLADKTFRDKVDLREHKKLIKETIHQVVPDLKVKVKSDRYIFDKDKVTSGQARRIGRLMAKTELNQYAHRRAVLFEGREITTI